MFFFHGKMKIIQWNCWSSPLSDQLDWWIWSFPKGIPELTGSSISAVMLSSNRNQKWVVQKIAPR